jgi:hypothetical protein
MGGSQRRRQRDCWRKLPGAYSLIELPIVLPFGSVTTQALLYIGNRFGCATIGCRRKRVRVQSVLILDGLQHRYNVGFENHASHDHFVENVVHPIGMKNQVQLTDILETLVERFNKDLDEIQNAQVALVRPRQRQNRALRNVGK